MKIFSLFPLLTISALILIGVAIIPLTSCYEKTEIADATRDVFAMDTYMQLTAYGNSAKKAVDEAQSEIQRLDSLFSVTNPDSDISRINSANGTATDVADETAELIEFAKKMCVQTNGALDITIYPLLREWGFTTGEYKIPGDEYITRLLRYTDYSKIQINGTSISIPKNFSIDLGAVAKGYTSEIGRAHV